ncbi:MAG: hypothetical protein VX928_03515, partial [Pseudomonadota bacterium]|nr:hypothetical protein [Pseudomonadota bacterium]
ICLYRILAVELIYFVICFFLHRQFFLEPQGDVLQVKQLRRITLAWTNTIAARLSNMLNKVQAESDLNGINEFQQECVCIPVIDC